MITPSAAHGLFAILAALAARDRTGRGTHIDQSQIEVAGAIMGPMLLDYRSTGTNPARTRRPEWSSAASATTAGWPSSQQDDGDWQHAGPDGRRA